MTINTVIDYLNTTYGYEIESTFFRDIHLWKDWWRGYNAEFHRYISLENNKRIERKLFSLKMAKKVCEDWASILLNEKFEVIIDNEQSQELIDEFLADKKFYLKANKAIEKAFFSGTCAFVLRIDNLLLTGESVKPDIKSKIRVECLDATHIIPITVIDDEVIEVALFSETIKRGKEYIYLERHLLENGEYTIYNDYFVVEKGALSPADLPDGVLPSFKTGSNIPLFSLIKPSIVENYEYSNGLGMSVFANAIDELKGVDYAFNNFCRDFKLGGKKVFYNSSLVKYDEYGNTITPDDVMQQLFTQVGSNEDFDGNSKPITEYNPTLRVEENEKGVQAMLDYLSFKCGMGMKHYQFNGSTVVTATQYSGDKQDLLQHAQKHKIQLNTSLTQIMRAILWAFKNAVGLPVDETAEINISFDDGYFNDDATEKETDRQDVRDGIMQKYEFRMKWYDEDEETAKTMVTPDAVNENPFNFTQ